jgi:ADP-ribose pyrophosphatase
MGCKKIENRYFFMNIRPWQVVSSRPLNHYKIFETRTDRVISPRTQQEHDVYVLTGASWVNILAYTEDQKIVIVQQYRHGIREVMWEIPGGVIDPGETPIQAATRELLEETGYRGNTPTILGKVHPNPAYQTNTCYTVLIEGARFLHSPLLESMEDIAVKLVDETEFQQMIVDGRITHSLVVVADLWRRLWRSGEIRPTMLE